MNIAIRQKRHLLLGSILLAACMPLYSFAQATYYRYVNDDGVKVINQSIPPRYVNNGYEIINRRGDVIDVIPPAPKPEELEVLKAQKALMTDFKRLKRRYSSVEDIDAAKERRVKHIKSNVVIQNSNLNNILKQIEALREQAAEFERANQQVPAHILEHLSELKIQYSAVDDVLKLRKVEYEETVKKYDDNKALFEQGLALQEQIKNQKQQLLREAQR